MRAAVNAGSWVTRAVAVVTGFAGLVVTVAALAAWWVAAPVLAVDGWWDDLGELPEQFDAPAERSVVYDADGNELATWHAEENRVYTPLDEIGDRAAAAVVATEDAAFYEHDGVATAAVARALVTNVASDGIQQGGSTITQQLVKNLTGDDAVTLERKAAEAKLALKLERHMSKDEILERYLNQAYFGSGVYGIGTAAEHYFGVTPDELDWHQAATLAGLLRYPEGNNPLRNPDAARQRRDVVLAQLARNGEISEEAAAAYQRRDLDLDPSPLPPPTEPFFAEWVKQRLLDDPRLGDTRDERIDMVFGGGLEVHTTIDPTLQRHAENALSEHVDDPAADPMAALITVDPSTGEVLAMALGPREFGECPNDDPDCVDRTQVNPAVPDAGGSGRQTGSAFKPFVAAAAVENALTPSWRTDTTSGREIPGCVDGTGPWRPTNYAGGGGVLAMPDAMRVSSNVYFAMLTGELGPEEVRDHARDLGLQRGHQPDGCAIGLGAGDSFPVEMAAAYGTFAADGRHCRPSPIDRVVVPGGEELTFAGECEQRLEAGTARQLTALLQEPVRPGGTGTSAAHGVTAPVAGKTGTTDQHVDAWFVGFTAPGGDGQFATAAWVGFEQPAPLTGVLGHARVTGGTVPAAIWGEYHRRAQEDVTFGEEFPEPPPAELRVPDVVDEDADDAVRTLESAGLRVTARDTAHWADEGAVAFTDPPAGQQVARRSHVTIAVSDGSGDAPQVPDVTGLTEDLARRALQRVGVDVHTETADTGPHMDGRVVSQDPAQGATVSADTAVTLTVGEHTPTVPERPDPEDRDDEGEEDDDRPSTGDEEEVDGDDDAPAGDDGDA